MAILIRTADAATLWNRNLTMETRFGCSISLRTRAAHLATITRDKRLVDSSGVVAKLDAKEDLHAVMVDVEARTWMNRNQWRDYSQGSRDW